MAPAASSRSKQPTSDALAPTVVVYWPGQHQNAISSARPSHSASMSSYIRSGGVKAERSERLRGNSAKRRGRWLQTKVKRFLLNPVLHWLGERQAAPNSAFPTQLRSMSWYSARAASNLSKPSTLQPLGQDVVVRLAGRLQVGVAFRASGARCRSALARAASNRSKRRISKHWSAAET